MGRRRPSCAWSERGVMIEINRAEERAIRPLFCEGGKNYYDFDCIFMTHA
jgi:hypothetical protein